jgi:filamentous hemagglutinin family protein
MLIQQFSEPYSIKQRFGEAACFCLLMVTQAALANPTGAQVISGSATITPPGNAVTTIQQHSANAVIHWQDFSIGAHETTQFIQPSAQSIAVNRVMGGNPSKIMGNLKANGNIYLLNSNGILFGKGSKVDVGGLVASTGHISDQAIFSGKPMKFSPGNPGASIVNEGTISIKNAGLAVLVAPTVVNKGIIEANLGKVVIAAAEHFTFDPYGDNLITFDAGPAATDLLLENAGTIQADGGRVYLTAQATGALLQNLINMNGYIQAQSIKEHNGKVVLEGTTVQIAGKIDVSGKVPGLTGGQAQVTGETVHLYTDTLIDASGASGGGTVNIGGEFQGRGALAHATDLVMETGSLITADAIQQGDGGTISLWSDNNTQAWGTLTARGGAQGGNGGMIETSGQIDLNTEGISIDASAPHGKGGTWLLDPLNASVSDANAGLYSFLLQGGTNVSIWANNNINFNNTVTPISWATSATFNARADFSQSGVGTIIFAGGALINAPAGTVNFYYNPAVFATPDPFPQVTAATFNPYMLVNNATQMQNLNLNLAGFYALNNNIDLSSIGNFQSIGGEGNPAFTGKFTGAVYQSDSNVLTQYSISNLSISSPLTEIGLFGLINATAVISDVALINANVQQTGAQSRTGALVGHANGGTLSGNLSSTNGTVNSNGVFVGGLIGEIDTATVVSAGTTFSNSGGSVTGSNRVGGLIGIINAGVTWNTTALSSNSSTVTGLAGAFDLGGLIGLVVNSNFTNPFSNTGTVSAPGGSSTLGGIFGDFTGSSTGLLTNTASITGQNQVGGIAGAVEAASSLSNAQQTGGTITATANSAGGIVGQANGNILQSTVSGTTVTASLTSAGGIAGVTGAGANLTTVQVSQSTISSPISSGGIFGNGNGGLSQGLVTDSTISGNSFVGGIAGSSTGPIDSAAVLRSVISATGASPAALGGLIGSNAGTASNLFFSGSVSAASGTQVGGLAGVNTGTIQNGLGAGFVSGGSPVGSLIGDNTGGTLTASFYDTSVNRSINPVGLGSSSGAIAGNYSTLGNLSTYTSQGWSSSIWQSLSPLAYPSLIWCGDACVAPLFLVVADNGAVTTQIVNAENTFRISLTYTYDNAIALAATDLNVIPASNYLSFMNISSTSPEYGAVADWLANTTVLQWLDTGNPGDQTQYVLDALKGAVSAEKSALSCP